MPSSSPRLGRRPDPATQRRRQQRLDRFRTSGLTVADFWEREGISTASLLRLATPLQGRPGTGHC